MQQVVNHMDDGVAVMLSIDSREVFTDDFRQYARATMVARAAQALQKHLHDTNGNYGATDQEAVSAEATKIVKKALCDCCSRALLVLMSDIAKEMKSGEADDAMKELLGIDLQSEN